MAEQLPKDMKVERDSVTFDIRSRIYRIGYNETRNLTILGYTLTDKGTTLSQNQVGTIRTMQSPENLIEKAEELDQLASYCQSVATTLKESSEKVAALRAQIPQTISFLRLPLEVRSAIYGCVTADSIVANPPAGSIVVNPRRRYVQLGDAPILPRHPLAAMLQTCVQVQPDLVPMIMASKSTFVIQATDRQWLHLSFQTWFEDGNDGKVLDLRIGGSFDDSFRITINSQRSTLIMHTHPSHFDNNSILRQAHAKLTTKKKNNQMIGALSWHIRIMVNNNRTGGLGMEELEKLRSILATYLPGIAPGV